MGKLGAILEEMQKRMLNFFMNIEKKETYVYDSGVFRYHILEDETAEIIKCWGATQLADLKQIAEIPETLDGKTVTSIRMLNGWELTSLRRDEDVDWCPRLTRITIPKSVTQIIGNPFAWCRDLETILVEPENPVFASIDGVLFNKIKKTLISYPNGKKDKIYEIPRGIRKIGKYAFCGTDYLEKVVLPDTVTRIGRCAFAFSRLKQSVTIPNGVTSIAESTFQSCNHLSGVQIPDSVTSIGEDAFAWCFELKSITIPDSVTQIVGNPFKGCEGSEIFVSPENPTFAAMDNVLFNREEETLIYYSAKKEDRTYQIPQGVRRIEKMAFYVCPWHLYGSVLTNVSIPDSVVSIGEEAFSGHSNLTLTVSSDSYAAKYAKDNSLKYGYPDSNDWLNN